MTGQIKYDFGGIDQAVAELNRHVGAFESHRGELQSAVNTLLGSWQGADREAYLPVQTRFDQAYADLTAALADIGRAVDQGNADMRATNARAAASWG